MQGMEHEGRTGAEVPPPRSDSAGAAARGDLGAGAHEAVAHGTGAHRDRGEHAGHMGHMGDLRRRFFISLILALPILLLSPMMGLRLPFQFSFPGSDWLVLGLATALFFYGGMPFLRGAAAELKNRAPAMMTLIALGIGVAYLYSVYAFVLRRAGGGMVMDFFWELATLILIMLLGHWVEMRAVAGAGGALKEMAALLPARATLVEADGTSRQVDLNEVKAGDRLLVKAGDRVPADGIIVEGRSSVNEAMVTGEARAVPKGVGDRVIGGSVNDAGTITVEVKATGESGFLAQVMRLVSSAQGEKSRAESMADKVARLLFYVAVGAGLAAFAAWYAHSGDAGLALSRMVTVLVIACPHALGLAIPLVVARSTSLGARRGLLVRDRRALEAGSKVDTVMMDKTGTLTEGSFEVTALRVFPGGPDENGLLGLAAALEQGSSHPLAAGILRAAESRGLRPPVASDLKNLPGAGLEGRVNGREVKIVSPAYLDGNGVAYPKEDFQDLPTGSSLSVVLQDGRAVGLVAQGDRLRAEAAETVAELKKRGINPVMLTGDNPDAAAVVARALGLSDVHAGLRPEDKEKIVREYQAAGHRVLMAGDGVNDAPALARADVGVAIGAGTDVAVDSADVVLVRDNPHDITSLLSLARNTVRKMKENLWWGAGYNIVAIPLAAGVLAPVGVLLSPAAGAVLMSLSTVIVALNAMLLKIR